MEWTLEEQILAFAEKRRTVLQNRGEGFYRIEEKDFTEQRRGILQNKAEGFYRIDEKDLTDQSRKM